MKYRTRPKRVVCFVFCAVRYLIVEWAKSIVTMSHRNIRMIRAWEAKHFRKWMLGRCVNLRRLLFGCFFCHTQKYTKSCGEGHFFVSLNRYW